MDQLIMSAEYTEPLIKIYADGACRGNPGPGGWGVLLLTACLLYTSPSPRDRG